MQLLQSASSVHHINAFFNHVNVCLLFFLSTMSTCLCVTTQPPPDAFSVRLVRGYSASSGHVQVFDGEAWGKICLRRFDWTLNEATVTCRQLGYPSALSSWEILEDYSRDYVVTRNVACVGNESRLIDCDFKVSKTYYCGPGFPNMYDVLVVCEPNQGDLEPPYLLQLIHGNHETEGTVELMPYQSQWTICSDSFYDSKEATVVCRELGFEYAAETYTDNHFSTGPGSLTLRFLRCNGGEKYLLECPHRITPAKFCYFPVGGVKCSSEPSPLPGAVIRLTGSPNADEGHVQTFYNGQWWNICNDGLWSDREAVTTCRSMGYSTGWPLFTLRYTQEYKDTSTDDALITGVRCRGTESNLTECLFDVSYTTNCGFYVIAAVHCSSSSSINPLVPYGVKIRLANGTDITSGRVEVYRDDQWWSVCGLSGWDRTDADVLCHQIGFGGVIYTGAEQIYGMARPDMGILYSNVECTGNEQRLDQCQVSMETSECNHNNDVYVECFSFVYVDKNRYTPAVTDEASTTLEAGHTTLVGGGYNRTKEGVAEPTGDKPGDPHFSQGAIIAISVVGSLLCIIALFLLWKVVKTRRGRANGHANTGSSQSTCINTTWSKDGQPQSYQPVPGETEIESPPTASV